MYVLRHRYVSLLVRFPLDFVRSCGNPEYTIIHNGQPDQMNASVYLLVWYLYTPVACCRMRWVLSYFCIYGISRVCVQFATICSSVILDSAILTGGAPYNVRKAHAVLRTAARFLVVRSGL
jgi:hypothetical protein